MAAARSEIWGKLLHKYIYGGPLWVWSIKIKSVGLARAHILIRHNCELELGPGPTPSTGEILNIIQRHQPILVFHLWYNVSETLGEYASTWFFNQTSRWFWYILKFHLIKLTAIFLGPFLQYQLSIITKITRLLYLCLPKFLSIFNKATNGLMAWSVDEFRYRQIDKQWALPRMTSFYMRKLYQKMNFCVSEGLRICDLYPYMKIMYLSPAVNFSGLFANDETAPGLLHAVSGLFSRRPGINKWQDQLF